MVAIYASTSAMVHMDGLGYPANNTNSVTLTTFTVIGQETIKADSTCNASKYILAVSSPNNIILFDVLGNGGVYVLKYFATNGQIPNTTWINDFGGNTRVYGGILNILDSSNSILERLRMQNTNQTNGTSGNKFSFMGTSSIGDDFRYACIDSIMTNSKNTFWGGDLAFGTAYNSGNPSYVMRIRSTGTVEIYAKSNMAYTDYIVRVTSPNLTNLMTLDGNGNLTVQNNLTASSVTATTGVTPSQAYTQAAVAALNPGRIGNQVTDDVGHLWIGSGTVTGAWWRSDSYTTGP
jgi:hypothetical protein